MKLGWRLTGLLIRGLGMLEYGVEISTDKRVTSFDVSLRPGELIAPCPTPDLPWCGVAINTESLDVKSQPGVVDGKFRRIVSRRRRLVADWFRDRCGAEMADRMTVQRHKRPGEGLKRAMAKSVASPHSSLGPVN